MQDPIPALKQRLAQAILEEIGERNMWMAGRMLGLDQPDMWKLEHGRLGRFSVHKLVRLLARINRRVDISVVAVDPLPMRLIRECERGVIRDPDGSFDIASRRRETDGSLNV